jgi:hypothetical protein
MDGTECEIDEVKSLEASKTSDNIVSIIYKDDPEANKVNADHFFAYHITTSAAAP